MTDPVSFSSKTARHGFPVLFPGQAQKEFYLNQSLCQIDMLLHPVVEGEAASPPSAPLAGQAWIVASAANGAWTGCERTIAAWDGSQWLFASPPVGMAVFDRSLSARWRYDGQWKRSVRPAAPAGGTVIDVQARAAIATLLDLLQANGTFSAV